MAGDPTPKKKPASPRVFECPSCGAGIPLRAIGLTVNVACSSCGALIDAANENYRILATVEKKTPVKPLIPLGTRGKIKGLTWEVIGYMHRSDLSGNYPWREYLLFNPYHGFRWLTESDGHWNFVTMTRAKPERTSDTTVTFKDETYQVFHRGAAKVTYVLGEFYWRVKVGETVHVEDYIHPPMILSAEKNDREIMWSAGEYLEPEVVKEAFKLKRSLPLRSGVAPNQLSTMHAIAPRIYKLAGLFIGLLVALQLFALLTARNQEVFRQDGVYQASDPRQTQVSPTFELPGRLGNVEIRLESGVNNAWLSLDGSLVHAVSGKTYDFEEGVEYWSGYDSDGPWSEGSWISREVLSSVPSGTYRLTFDVSADPTITQQPYTLVVKRGVVTWSNFFASLILLGILPLIVWWRDRSFDVARWSTSDYSPYASSEEDDDE